MTLLIRFNSFGIVFSSFFFTIILFPSSYHIGPFSYSITLYELKLPRGSFNTIIYPVDGSLASTKTAHFTMTNLTASPSSSNMAENEAKGKRKASTAGLPANARPVKRRASKACCCCRARKVRCDVVENGSPCTNCRLDQVDCIVTESKRRKFVHAENMTRLPHSSQNRGLTSSALLCHFPGNHVLRLTTPTTSSLNRPRRLPKTEVFYGDSVNATGFRMLPQRRLPSVP